MNLTQWASHVEFWGAGNLCWLKVHLVGVKFRGGACGALPRTQQWWLGSAGPHSLGGSKFSAFLFVPYRMSFFLATVNILLLVHDAGESLFKKPLYFWSSFGIVRKIVIWRLKKKKQKTSKWFNLSEPQSFHLLDENNNAIFVLQEMVKDRWENIIDTNCKALLFILFLFFLNEKSLPTLLMWFVYLRPYLDNYTDSHV